jgi:hypothetical protein
MPEVIIRKPNIKLKMDKSMPIKVYKCPFLNCDEVFIDQDGMNEHRVYVHADIPKTELEIIMPSGKLFDKRQIFTYQAQLQREALGHKLKALGAVLAENRARAKVRAEQRRQKREEKAKAQASQPAQVPKDQPVQVQPAPSILHKVSKWMKSHPSKQ